MHIYTCIYAWNYHKWGTNTPFLFPFFAFSVSLVSNHFLPLNNFLILENQPGKCKMAQNVFLQTKLGDKMAPP
jgi:hypothetical protein